MLCGGSWLSAAPYFVAFRVGYESPSQFSREYRRHFGEPRARDIARLHASPGLAMIALSHPQPTTPNHDEEDTPCVRPYWRGEYPITLLKALVNALSDS